MGGLVTCANCWRRMVGEHPRRLRERGHRGVVAHRADRLGPVGQRLDHQLELLGGVPERVQQAGALVGRDLGHRLASAGRRYASDGGRARRRRAGCAASCAAGLVRADQAAPTRCRRPAAGRARPGRTRRSRRGRHPARRSRTPRRPLRHGCAHTATAAARYGRARPHLDAVAGNDRRRAVPRLHHGRRGTRTSPAHRRPGRWTGRSMPAAPAW